MRLEGALATDVGKVRDINQDRCHFGGSTAAVADGMGGHVGGERAAALAIESFESLNAPNAPELLEAVLGAANDRVMEASIEEGLAGMGTTMVALAMDAGRALVRLVNVGDSRGYLFRGGQLTQITVDHSLVQDLVNSGQLDPGQAQSHPQRNIVTRALGIDANLDVDTFDVSVQDGDLFLLCSDGLSNEVTDDAVAELLGAGTDLQETANLLVSTASENGGKDNITVVLVKVIAEEGDTFDPLDLSADESDITPPTFGGTTDPGLSEPGLSEPGQISESSVAAGNRGPQRPSGSGGTEAEDQAIGSIIEVRSYEVQVLDETSNQTGSASVANVDTLGLLDPEEGLLHANARLGQPDAKQRSKRVRPKRKRSRSAKLATLFSLAAVFALAFGSATWYGRNAWFADTSSGQVVILRGRPDGFLWIEPAEVEATDISLNDLEGDAQDRLGRTPTWSSLSAARTFVESLEQTPEAARTAEAESPVEPGSSTEPDS